MDLNNPIIRIVGNKDMWKRLNNISSAFSPEQIEAMLRGKNTDTESDNYFTRLLNQAKKEGSPKSTFEQIVSELINNSSAREKATAEPKEAAAPTASEIRINLMELKAEDIKDLSMEELNDIIDTLNFYMMHITASNEIVRNRVMELEQNNHNNALTLKENVKQFITKVNGLITDVKLQMPELDKSAALVKWCITDRLLVLEAKNNESIRNVRNLLKAVDEGYLSGEAHFKETFEALLQRGVLITQAKQLGEELFRDLTANGY